MMANPFDRFDSASGGNPFDRFDASAPNADYERGKSLPSSLQGLFSAMQGLTLGFGDELAGAAGAVAGGVGNLVGQDDGTDFGERYRRTRDAVRGAQDQFMQDRPVLGMATRLMAGAPFVAVGGPAGPGAGVVGAGRQGIEAAKVAAALGAAQGAGESKAADLAGVLQDAGTEGLKAGALGGITTGVLAKAADGGAAVKRILSKNSAEDFARLKVAEAIARDSPKNPIAIEEAADALRKLGPESRLVDAAGRSTTDLLDTMATLPGATRNASETAIRARQAGRGARFVSAADDALEAGGQGLKPTLKALAEQKKMLATPYYRQLENVLVPVDDEVLALLNRAKPYDDVIRRQSLTEFGVPVNISEIKPGDMVPFKTLDTLKQSLWSAAEGYRDQFGKATRDTSLINDLRAQLIEKLDRASPRNQSGSIYKQARDAFGGVAELESAARAGADAMKVDVSDLADLVGGMSGAQLDAFRIGALNAMKQQAGTRGGQNKLLNAWMEPNTGDRLRVIFGDNFSKFSEFLSGEGKMKALEGVGRGSQTARRQFDAGDADIDPTAVLDMARGNVVGPAVGFAKQAWNRVRTPEATRDEIGRLLLTQGDEAMNTTNMLREYLQRVNEARLGRARAAGAFAGVNPYDNARQ